MVRAASARKVTVASAMEAADALPKESSAPSRRPEPADGERASGKVTLETALAESEFAPPEGYQEKIRAYLEAELEAGATLYDFPEDGSCVAITKSGERVIR